MKVTQGHCLMPVLAVVAGAALIYAGAWAGWGAVWAAAGGFFVVIGISAFVLLLAWLVPGPVGDLLRPPAVSVLIVVAVIALLILTLGLAIIGSFRRVLGPSIVPGKRQDNERAWRWSTMSANR